MAVVGNLQTCIWVFYANFFVMAVVGNFNFLFSLQLTWEFLDLESKRGGSVCWTNNKIIDYYHGTVISRVKLTCLTTV